MSVTFVQLTRHYYRAMQEISFRNDILPLKDKLYRLAFRITLNSAEAEDVVQDTMIRVWNKRDEWPNFESIEAYCLTVARNLAIDRSEKIDSQHMELTPETQELPDALNPYEQLAQSEQLGLNHRLLNELPEKQRSIMQLRDIEGKSYKEIADNLIDIDYTYDDIIVKGVIGKPVISRSNRSNQLFFVINRFVKER